jgi:hypothetical protein
MDTIIHSIVIIIIVIVDIMDLSQSLFDNKYVGESRK